MFDIIPPETMQAARIVTAATLALWMGVGWVPPLQRHATRIRAIVLTLYLLSCLGFIIYVLYGK